MYLQWRHELAALDKGVKKEALMNGTPVPRPRKGANPVFLELVTFSRDQVDAGAPFFYPILTAVADASYEFTDQVAKSRRA
jgi:hypothetical protein